MTIMTPVAPTPTSTYEVYEEPLTEVQTQQLLSPSDRCDADSSARAVSIVFKEDATLHLSNHYLKKHEEALVADGWSIIDQSKVLIG